MRKIVFLSASSSPFKVESIYGMSLVIAYYMPWHSTSNPDGSVRIRQPFSQADIDSYNNKLHQMQILKHLVLQFKVQNRCITQKMTCTVKPFNLPPSSSSFWTLNENNPLFARQNIVFSHLLPFFLLCPFCRKFYEKSPVTGDVICRISFASVRIAFTWTYFPQRPQ